MLSKIQSLKSFSAGDRSYTSIYKIQTYFLAPDFSCLTPTKMPLQVEMVSRDPIIPSQTTSPFQDDYLDLKDCGAGYQNDKKIEAALTYVNDVNRIQVYRSPNSTERRKASGEGSSVSTDLGDFLNVEDVYNVPRICHGHGRDSSGEYKMPKCCGSASSGLDQSSTKESSKIVCF